MPCKANFKARLPLTNITQVEFGLAFGVGRYTGTRSNITTNSRMHRSRASIASETVDATALATASSS